MARLDGQSSLVVIPGPSPSSLRDRVYQLFLLLFFLLVLVVLVGLCSHNHRLRIPRKVELELFSSLEPLLFPRESSLTSELSEIQLPVSSSELLDAEISVVMDARAEE